MTFKPYKLCIIIFYYNLDPNDLNIKFLELLYVKNYIELSTIFTKSIKLKHFYIQLFYFFLTSVRVEYALCY